MSHDFASYGRQGAEKRWAAHRAARLAAGLPATAREESGKAPDYFDDAEVERFWMQRAEDAGLIPEGATRRQHRRIARRFADANAAEIARAGREGAAAGVSDVDVLIAHHEAEVARWRAAAEQDRARALEHDRLAELAEGALTDLLFREGRLS